MATTFVDLSNRALRRLGQSPISSFDDGSEEASICAEFNQPVLNALLANPQSATFATYSWQWPRRVASGTSGASTNPRWGYEYVLPSDCINVSELIDPSIPATHWKPERRLFRDVIPFEEGIGGEDPASPVPVIWCNLPAISVFYISNALPIDSWPPAFMRAYYLALACEIAVDLGNNPALTANAQADAARALDAAIQADQRVQTVSASYVPDWMEVRGGCFDPRHEHKRRAEQSAQSFPSGYIVGQADAASPIPYHLKPADSLNGVPSMGIPDDSVRNRHALHVHEWTPDSRIGVLAIGSSPVGWRRPFHTKILNAAAPDASGEYDV